MTILKEKYISFTKTEVEERLRYFKQYLKKERNYRKKTIKKKIWGVRFLYRKKLLTREDIEKTNFSRDYKNFFIHTLKVWRGFTHCLYYEKYKDKLKGFTFLKEKMYNYLREHEHLSDPVSRNLCSKFKILYLNDLLNKDENELERFLSDMNFHGSTKTQYRRAWYVWNQKVKQ